MKPFHQQVFGRLKQSNYDTPRQRERREKARLLFPGAPGFALAACKAVKLKCSSVYFEYGFSCMRGYKENAQTCLGGVFTKKPAIAWKFLACKKLFPHDRPSPGEFSKDCRGWACHVEKIPESTRPSCSPQPWRGAKDARANDIPAETVGKHAREACRPAFPESSLRELPG